MFFKYINLDMKKIATTFETLFNKWSTNKKYFNHDENDHI
jgi:hypothetical protein